MKPEVKGASKKGSKKSAIEGFFEKAVLRKEVNTKKKSEEVLSSDPLARS